MAGATNKELFVGGVLALSALMGVYYAGYTGVSSVYNNAVEPNDTEDYIYTEMQGGAVTKQIVSDRFETLGNMYGSDFLQVTDKFSGASEYVNTNITTIETVPEMDKPLTAELSNDL